MNNSIESIEFEVDKIVEEGRKIEKKKITNLRSFFTDDILKIIVPFDERDKNPSKVFKEIIKEK